MKPSPAAFGVALAFAVAAVSDARADTPPTAWDRVKDPTARAAYELHLDVIDMLDEARLAQRLPGPFVETDFAHGSIQRAVDKLERFGAEKSADVRLRFDLGAAYVELAPHEVDRKARYEKAIAVLRAAVDMAPDHPGADDALWNLAVACGHVGDTACEKKAYVDILRKRTEEEARATPSLNLAETEMHLGHLKDAIDGYRETIRLAGRLQSDTITAPLAVWGLAIALDRSGDHVGAEREAKFALELELSNGWRSSIHPTKLLRSSGVFFYPVYEIHWYEGLESVTRARQAKSPGEAAELFRLAERSFGLYVQAAERDKDRWLEIAKARLAAAKSEREKAEKRAGPQAPPREPDRGPAGGISF